MKDMIHRGRGLVDLITGKLPTFSGWDADPTDGADITDGDISTFCTTGTTAASAYQYVYIDYDLGSFYDVFCTGVCGFGSSAGDPRMYLSFWDGAAWIRSSEYVQFGTSVRSLTQYGAMCSKVRLGIASDQISTLTPNIREFHVWRM